MVEWLCYWSEKADWCLWWWFESAPRAQKFLMIYFSNFNGFAVEIWLITGP